MKQFQKKHHAISMALVIFLAGCQNNQKQGTMPQLDVEAPTPEQVFIEGEAVGSTISLAEAIARAVKSNLSYRSSIIGASSEGISLNNSNLPEQCSVEQNRLAILSMQAQRRLTQELVAQVHQQYYNVVALTKITNRIGPMQKEVYDALEYPKVIYGDNANPPVEVLQYQRALQAMLYQLQQWNVEYIEAKAALAVNMGFDPKRNYNVEPNAKYSAPLPLEKGSSLRSLESHALIMHPNVLSAYCSPAFFVEKQSLSLSSLLSPQVTTSLVSSEKDQAALKLNAAAHRAIANINQSYLIYEQVKKELDAASRLSQIDGSIIKASQDKQVTQLSEHLDLIKQKMNQLSSQYEYELAYAKWQSAAAQIILHSGYDRVPLSSSSLGLDALKNDIANRSMMP